MQISGFVGQCCLLVVSSSVTPWTVALQTSLSMGFPRQEYWSGLVVTASSRDLPAPGIKPVSPASPALAGGFFITEPPGKPFVGQTTSMNDGQLKSHGNLVALD